MRFSKEPQIGKTDLNSKQRCVSLNSDGGILWRQSRDSLVSMISLLGFPTELGELIARHLGSPKAMDRMTAYLDYERPTDERMVVDEMLAISSEIEAWRDKKESLKLNAAYNELLYSGLE